MFPYSRLHVLSNLSQTKMTDKFPSNDRKNSILPEFPKVFSNSEKKENSQKPQKNENPMFQRGETPLLNDSQSNTTDQSAIHNFFSDEHILEALGEPDRPVSTSEKIQLTFGLPKSELYCAGKCRLFLFHNSKLIKEYPCWLIKSLLLRGHMFITTNHVCFYAQLDDYVQVILKY